MSSIARSRIGLTIDGDVLEVGPGASPFPTAPGARLMYADRSVEGGRSENWPELAEMPSGPQAHYNVDLNTQGLRGIADGSFDAVIACHVIEHVVNPLVVIQEFRRVLRHGGRLVLVVPDRTRTFDYVRKPTSFSHLLAEYRSGVQELGIEHIQEYCASMYMQPWLHPERVRDWHNPRKLDNQRIELHRRRSIHVHCWRPEEFAVAIVAAISSGLMSWRLKDIYFFEEGAGEGNEFGLVLESSDGSSDSLTTEFLAKWCLMALERPGGEGRVAWLERVLARDLQDHKKFRKVVQIALAGRNKPRLPLLDTSVLPRWKAMTRQTLRDGLDHLIRSKGEITRA